ncbi:MAG: DUF4422 domain-containing protein [Eubacteriales bacterium]|nr:DUF4422 domain-containing protein [Eubacteriales bacterium]
MKITAIVVAHKSYWMPEDTQLYWPLLVGAAGKEAGTWHRDDEGENISAKNPTFCELTGHYWMWKNIDAEVYGLCHYRRYFATGCFLHAKKNRILNQQQLERRMRNVAVLLPKKRHYYIETNYSQYCHAHHQTDLDTTKEILRRRAPDYIADWDRVMARRSGHRFNMFFMRKAEFAAYSAWLFPILFALEKQLDIRDYAKKDQRVFGYVAERLLDVWLLHNHPAYRECRIVNLESQHWGKKIGAFLCRKWRGSIRQS